jgi:lysine biosynthesis protein LysW
MATATCVECDEEIEINDRPRRGLRVICPNCGAQLEVISTNPVELDVPFDDDEEWDDDDDFETAEEDEVEFDDDFEDDEWEDDYEDDDDDDDDWN